MIVMIIAGVEILLIGITLGMMLCVSIWKKDETIKKDETTTQRKLAKSESRIREHIYKGIKNPKIKKKLEEILIAIADINERYDSVMTRINLMFNSNEITHQKYTETIKCMLEHIENITENSMIHLIAVDSQQQEDKKDKYISEIRYEIEEAKRKERIADRKLQQGFITHKKYIETMKNIEKTIKKLKTEYELYTKCSKQIKDTDECIKEIEYILKQMNKAKIKLDKLIIEMIKLSNADNKQRIIVAMNNMDELVDNTKKYR